MNYGKQANAFLASTGTKLTMINLPIMERHFESDRKYNVWRDVWEVTIQRAGKEILLSISQPLVGSRPNTMPTKYDVLVCLTKHDPGTFKDFCFEYGYDEYATDSHSALLKIYKIYEAVVKEYEKVCHIWSGTDLELLRAIFPNERGGK